MRLSSFPCAGCRKQCLSEMLGTSLLVFFGPGSIIVASALGFAPLQTLEFVAAVFGGTVALVIVFLGSLSGAYINPAITLGGALAGLLRRELILPYVLFQTAGGLVAGLCLRVAFGASGSGTDLGSTRLASGVSPVEGVLVEMAGTLVLTMAALTAGSRVSGRAAKALLVGGTLFVLILLVGPLTGASFNPARSLGPSLFSGYLSNQLIYYVGPTLGAGCAGLMFGALETHGKSS